MVGMTKWIDGDIIEHVKQNKGCFMMHVCNNKGVMGSGVALQVKKAFPQAYMDYKDTCNGLIEAGGHYTMSKPVINLIAQDGYYGYQGDYTKRVFLNYDWLEKSVKDSLHYLEYIDYKDVAVPLKMGSDRAGGDWDKVLEIVEKYCRKYELNLTVVRYEKKL